MKILRLFLLLGVIVLLTVGCESISQLVSPSGPTAPTQSAPSVPWRLSSFTTGGQELAALASNPVTLQFDPGGKLSGSTGCNAYMAGYAVQGDTIALHDIVMTQRACVAPEAAQQEQRFLQALAATGSYQVSNGRMTITYNSTDKLNFVQDTGAASPANTAVAIPGAVSNTPAAPANTPIPAVSWKRQHFGTLWNVAFPQNWTVNVEGAKEGTVALEGPYGAHTYEIGLAYPVGVDAASLDAWVQQQVGAVPEADRANVKVSDLTVAGAPAKLVLNLPTASGGERTHIIYIWKAGDVNQRLIVIAQTDNQPFESEAMARLLDDFVFQIH